MTRIHLLVLSAALGILVAVGTYAALRTTHLGAAASAPRPTAEAVARRTRALDRVEASLRAQLRRRPPALPSLASLLEGSTASMPEAVGAPDLPRLVYVRPRPLVHVVHGRRGYDEEAEGGELDD